MPVVAVGALGAVIAALMALLVIYGIAILGRAIAQLVPNWHIPGLGNIRSAVSNLIDGVVSAVSDFLSMAVAPVENWLLAPYHLLNQMIGQLLNTAHDLYHFALDIKNYAHLLYDDAVKFVYRMIAGVEHLAYTLYAQALAYAARLVAGVYSYVAGRVAALEHLAYALYTAAANYAHSLYDDAVNFVYRTATGLENLITHYYAAAIREAQVLAAKAEAYAKAVAHSEAAAAVGALTTDVIHAIRVDWIKITDEVKALEQVIATDLPDIGTAVHAIETDLPLDIAGVLAGVVAIDIPMFRFLRECGIPNCKNTSKFGRDLQDLFAVVEGAAMLGFIEEMIREPQRTANATIDVLQPVFTGTVTALRDVVQAA